MHSHKEEITTRARWGGESPWEAEREDETRETEGRGGVYRQELRPRNSQERRAGCRDRKRQSLTVPGPSELPISGVGEVTIAWTMLINMLPSKGRRPHRHLLASHSER